MSRPNLEDLYNNYNIMSDREILTLCLNGGDSICNDQNYWAYRYKSFFGEYNRYSKPPDWKNEYMNSIVKEEE